MTEPSGLVEEAAELVGGPHPVCSVRVTSVFGGVGGSGRVVPQHVFAYGIPEGGPQDDVDFEDRLR